MPRPWLPLYCADYLADTADLDASEHGVYLLLIMHSWQRGPLPDDLERLTRLAAGARPNSVRIVLERYWVRTPDGWINHRVEKEREVAEEKYKRRAEAGRKGGAMLKQCLSNAQAMLNQPQPQPQEDLNTAPSVLVESQAFDPVDNSATPKLNGCPYQAIVDLYHELLVPPLPRVFQLTPARKQHMAARWRDELPDLADWRAYFGSVRQSKLVAGFRRPDGTYWKPNIDWLIKQGNLTKVAEGNYG